MAVKLSVRQIGQMNVDVKTLINFVGTVRAKPEGLPEELVSKSGPAADAAYRLSEIAKDLMNAEVIVKG